MKIMVAMSGGVDSSVAAALLVEQGHEVIGVHMKLNDGAHSLQGKQNSKVCCSIDDANDCRLVADKLGIRFFVLNMTKDFQKKVVDYFVESYRAGMTPSPCTMCNGEIKFSMLLEKAKLLGCDAIATGHYAKMVDGRLAASESDKDQSYFLFNIKKEYLPYVMFPVQSLEKEKVREIATKLNLVTANKRESMEICFVDRGHHSDLVANFIPKEEDVSAKIYDDSGNYLGEVDRYFRFTVGQRRGLPVHGYYIREIDVNNKKIIVSKEKALTKNISLSRTNWHEDISKIDQGRSLFARTRHKGSLYPVSLDGDQIIFDNDVQMPARGQVTVIYDDRGVVVGGGYIK